MNLCFHACLTHAYGFMLAQSALKFSKMMILGFRKDFKMNQIKFNLQFFVVKKFFAESSQKIMAIDFSKVKSWKPTIIEMIM